MCPKIGDRVFTNRHTRRRDELHLVQAKDRDSPYPWLHQRENRRPAPKVQTTRRSASSPSRTHCACSQKKSLRLSSSMQPSARLSTSSLSITRQSKASMSRYRRAASPRQAWSSLLLHQIKTRKRTITPGTC